MFEEKKAQEDVSVNYQDDFSDDEEDTDDDSEEETTNSCYHIKDLKLNFDGLIAIARQVNFNQEFFFFNPTNKKCKSILEELFKKYD